MGERDQIGRDIVCLTKAIDAALSIIGSPHPGMVPTADRVSAMAMLLDLLARREKYEDQIRMLPVQKDAA